MGSHDTGEGFSDSAAGAEAKHAPTKHPTSRPFPAHTPVSSRHALLLAWIGLLGGIAMIGVIMMPAEIWGGDPTAWREETRSIVYRHQLAVDPAITADFQEGIEPGQYYVQNPRNGNWYSKYGIVNSIMSVPPMFVQRLIHGDSPHYRDMPDVLIFNIWNILLTLALATVLMKLAAFYTRRLASRVVFVICVLYCTYLWYYLRAQSSEIYQTLFYCTAFLYWLRFARSFPQQHPEGSQKSGAIQQQLGLLLMWLFIGLLVLTRVLYGLLLPSYGVLLIVAIWRLPPQQRRAEARRLWPILLLPPAAIVVLLGIVNDVKFGSPLLSGYHQWRPEQHLPTGPIWSGLYGLLLHPRFSLLLYFPVFTLSLPMVWRFVRKYPLEAAAAIGGLLIFLLGLAKIPTWAGEWTYGPRYILFALPVASLGFIMLLDVLIDRVRAASLWALAASAGISSLLFYSAYIQFRANELDFFAYYYVRVPVDSQVAGGYLDRRPVGMILDDLLRHRDQLDSMHWFGTIRNSQTPADTAQYRQWVLDVLSRRNLYWLRRHQHANPGQSST
jgi:hypothetical protein